MNPEQRDTRDSIKDNTPAFLGHDLSEYIVLALPGVHSKGGFYLGLAAGAGIGERAFATGLGVEESKMCFVDKEFDVIEHFPAESTVTEDIFSFLRKPNSQKYDYVSAFGIEYVLTPEKLQELLTLLAAHLNPEACIVVYPYDKASVEHEFYESSTWNNQSQQARPVFYRFKGLTA